MSEPIWITEANVVELMHLGEAIPALEAGLMMEASGTAHNMVKTHVSWGNNNLHAIGASFAGAGLAGTKTWAHTEGGTCPLLLLFDAQTGALKAIIEAFALGQMRTAGISGVATRWLALPNASKMAIVGTGKQALAQVAAVASVRPLGELRVYSRSAVNRAAFIAKVRAQFSFDVRDAASVEQAVAGAEIVTLVTRATEPFLHAGMLDKGVHLNAVGAITPEREEFTQDVFARCGQVVVDSLPSAHKLSKEMAAQYGSDPLRWEKVQSLARLVADARPRAGSSDLTLFKAMGMGISDLALGAEIYQRARAAGVGRAIPQPKKASPRLTAG
jgi:alanine dehydrogenase